MADRIWVIERKNPDQDWQIEFALGAFRDYDSCVKVREMLNSQATTVLWASVPYIRESSHD